MNTFNPATTFDLGDEADKDILDSLFKDKSKANTSSTVDEIILIVDRSGSMNRIKDDAEGGVKAFIEDQKSFGEANLTIVEFDNRISTFCERVDIKNAPEYTLVPRGGTALYDAVGMTLANAEELKPTGKVIVAIVTDGAENSSREYTQQIVFDRIEELKKKEWEFMFLSADQDAFLAGGALGIDPDSTIAYNASGVGTQSAYDAINTYTTSLRTKTKSAALDDLKSLVDTSNELKQQSD